MFIPKAMDEVYFKDADLKNLKNDANEMEKASALVQIDINKTQKEIEDNGKAMNNLFSCLLFSCSFVLNSENKEFRNVCVLQVITEVGCST